MSQCKDCRYFEFGDKYNYDTCKMGELYGYFECHEICDNFQGRIKLNAKENPTLLQCVTCEYVYKCLLEMQGINNSCGEPIPVNEKGEIVAFECRKGN